jgi:hypothetical protein
MFDKLTLVKTSKPQEGQADLFQDGLHNMLQLSIHPTMFPQSVSLQHVLVPRYQQLQIDSMNSLAFHPTQ